MSDTKLKRPKKHIYITMVIATLSIVFIGLLTKGLTLDQTKVPPVNVDKPAKAFRVAWIQGQEHLSGEKGRTFRLEDFRGKRLVLNFWASWCVSCRQEAHELEAFWRSHGEDIQVVGIAIQDEPSDTKAFIKKFGKTYIIGLDEDGKAAIDYGVSGVPETFIIDEKGMVLHKETGPVSKQMLEGILNISSQG
jgi:cytochrome c biogenesis protein CcmG/thiol:disulfide interchange protein DsbE